MANGPDTPAVAAEKRRRRWITFGEIVAVLALAISAASFWDAHEQRVEDRSAAAKAIARPVPLVLTAQTADDGRRLVIAATRDRVIQTQTIVFPTALGLADVETVGNPRFEAAWFGEALKAAVPEPRARGRVPIGIVTRYLDDGRPASDVAIYDIGHGWRSRLLAGDAPVLEGLTLVEHSTTRTLKAAVDARWVRWHGSQASNPQ